MYAWLRKTIKGQTMINTIDKKPVDTRHVSIKPFVKWAGGKSQLLNEIKKIYPDELGKRITKYAEPFVGGGAVLFDILSNYKLDKLYIGDLNAELINAYQIIKNDVQELITVLKRLSKEYFSFCDEQKKEYYYSTRKRFNSLKLSQNDSHSIEKAALFIFLNKTCFNGLYRVNKKGLFNVPVGSYKNPTICDEDNLLNISDALKKVIIVCGDYRLSDGFIDEDTFVYFDPPYRPLSETASFTSYTKNNFGDEEQIELAKYVYKLEQRGAKIVISNSDPKNLEKKDEFFDKLYSTYQINRVFATRMINCNGNSRGKIKELLISTF